MVAGVFVSYARLDQKPLFPVKIDTTEVVGWVSCFAAHLSDSLASQLGRADYCNLWIDDELRENSNFERQIKEQLKAANLIVIMLSNSWLASDYCQNELQWFCEFHPDYEERIFVVKQKDISFHDARIPKYLNKLNGFPFYEKTRKGSAVRYGHPMPNAYDSDYFTTILDISNRMSETLDCLCEAVGVGKVASDSKSVEYATTVYVAQVGDGLFQMRQRMVSELKQFGIRVLPDSDTDLDEDIAANLEQSSHFIQLLDRDVMGGMIPAWQFQKAQENGLDIFQWRNPELEIQGVDETARRLLDGEHVVAMPLTDFTHFVRKKILSKLSVSDSNDKQDASRRTIFVHSWPRDMDAAKKITKKLRLRGFGTSLTRYEGEPREIDERMQEDFELCDAVLMIQEQTPATTVDDYMRKTIAKRNQSSELNKPVCICRCVDGDELYVMPSGVHELVCSGDFGTSCIEKFLGEVVK